MSGERIIGRAALTGCGFALGFGWVWFAGLQQIWLPLLLWGKSFSSGGTALFPLLLCAGFLLVPRVASLAWNGKKNAGFDRLFFAHAAHGVGLVFLALGVLSRHAGDSAFLSLLASLCAALAALPLGMFWVDRLIRLPFREAVFAFLLAACAAAILAPAAALTSAIPETRPFFLLLSVFAAWALAWGAAHSRHDSSTSHIKAKSGLERDSRGRGVFSFTILALFAVEGFVNAALPPEPARFADGAYALGALALYLAVYARHTCSFSFYAAVGLLILATGALLQPIWLFRPDCFGGGFLEGAVFLALALRVREQGSVALAGRALGLAVLGVFLGQGVGHALFDGAWRLGLTERLVVAAIPAALALAFAALRHMVDSPTPPPAPPAPFGQASSLFGRLTAREREVAMLVAQGHSNPEICSRLYISEGTLRVHLRRIYRKTGLSSRKSLQELAP